MVLYYYIAHNDLYEYSRQTIQWDFFMGLGKMQNSSLMISESDFSSDEETLFVNHKKTNGHVKNGLVKPGRNKVKT